MQALITDMNQPLGYAIGNALEVMEASQTLQNAGPTDLTRLSHRTGRAHDLPRQEDRDARRSARAWPSSSWWTAPATGSSSRSSQAQGGNPQALDKFELLPNATGMREITSPRAGYVSAIDAEDIGTRFQHDRRRARHARKTQSIRPWASSSKSRSGEKVDAGSVLCRLYYTKEDRVEEAAELVEDAFRISAQKPEERELILEVVG